MPSSSALGLADLALTWDVDSSTADLSMIDDDLASDEGIRTAVILSIFVDRRASNDDVPPSGDDTDRRGWWGDEFADVAGDRIGSRLWLLDRSSRTSEVVRLAELYVREALAWMIEDRVASSVDVQIETTVDRLLISVTLSRPSRDPIALRFARAWDEIVREPSMTGTYVELPDCDTVVHTDGPGAVFFPQTPGGYSCIPPEAGIPHPDFSIRFDGIAGDIAGSVIAVDIANDPAKTMVVAGSPSWQQVIAGWSSRAMTLPQVSSTGLRIPLDANGAWFDVGRQDVAQLALFGVTSSGGNRPFLSLAGTAIQLRITSAGRLSLFTSAGEVVGTYDYRHAGVMTIHPFLIGLKRSTSEIKVWTDKEVLTGSWVFASDAEKGLYVSGQAPPPSAWLGLDGWKGSKATAVFDLGSVLLSRLGWALAY